MGNVMMIQIYSKLVLLLDVCYFLVYSVWAIVQTLFLVLFPSKLKSLQDEVVVVVGASRGVGQEIASQLGLLKACVVCVDINSVKNEATVRQIRIDGGQAFAYSCDVTSNEEVVRIIQTIEREVSAITMLFHCCGVPSPRTYTNNPPAIHDTINVSVMSHFWILDALLPRLKQRNYGHIVLLSSVAGLAGIKNQMPLTVSQFAVQGLFESVTEELRASKYKKSVLMSMAFIYPFIITENMTNDIRFRIPSYFGTIKAKDAAQIIIEGVRRNDIEISIPKYWLWLGHLTRLIPRNAADKLRDLMDTGIDFG